MTAIILVRTGKTDWSENHQNRLQGWAATNITDDSTELVERTANHIKNAYRIDEIDGLYSSDLKRGAETAELIQDTYPESEIIYDHRLRERDAGAYQGFEMDDVLSKRPELSIEDAGQDALEVKPHLGESMVEVKERVMEFFKEITEVHDDTDIVVVVCHGGTAHIITSKLQNKDLASSFLMREFKEGGITVIDTHNKQVLRENIIPEL